MAEKVLWVALLLLCGFALLRWAVARLYAKAVARAINSQRLKRGSRRRLGRAKWREDVLREARHLLQRSEDEIEQRRRFQ